MKFYKLSLANLNRNILQNFAYNKKGVFMTSEQCFLECDLIERGWDKDLIAKFYEHREMAKTTTASERTYDKKIVHEIEVREDFKNCFASSAKKQAKQIVSYLNLNGATMTNHALQIQELVLTSIQHAAHCTILVKHKNIKLLAKKAFIGYTTSVAYRLLTGAEKGFATVVVDFIRQNETSYGFELFSLNNMRDVGESYGVNFTNFDLCRHLLKQHANTSIANTYPILATECMRQNTLLFDWHPRRDTYRNLKHNLAA